MIKRILNKLGVYKTYSLTIADKVFKVPVYKGIGFSNLNDAEPWMTSLIAKLGSNQCHFLDVGVNTGQTLLKWKSLFPEANYTGFEPNIRCVDYVRQLIKENSLVNCKIHPYGLSTSVSTTKLFLLGNDPADSTATTIKNFRENESRKEISIRTMPLRDLESKDFDLIKIDVEGAELEVLKSIMEVGNNAIIICEILPVYSSENHERLERQTEIEKILLENDYSIFRIIKSEPLKIEKIIEIGIHSDLEKSDYLFVPKSNEASIITKFD